MVAGAPDGRAGPECSFLPRALVCLLDCPGLHGSTQTCSGAIAPPKPCSTQTSPLPPLHHSLQMWLGLGVANANFLYASNLLLAGAVLGHVRALLHEALLRCTPTSGVAQKSLIQQPAPGAGSSGEDAGGRLRTHALRK